MAAKTTVSLPDDMHEWAKGQPDLNVSEVLRNALVAERAVREKLSTGDMAGALADRLQREGGKEVQARHPDLYRAGRSYAQQRLSIDELQDIAAWYREFDFDGEMDGRFVMGQLADLTDEYNDDHHAFNKWLFIDLLGEKRITPARVEAFAKGIVDMWTEAEALMDD